VVPLVVAVGFVSSAGANSTKPKAPLVSCTVSVTSQVPAGETVVLPSASQGQQWGSIECGKKLGSGVEHSVFKSPDTGDVSGTFKAYFTSGLLRGKYALTQQEGTLSTSFTSASYTGTVIVTGGTGAFNGARGKGTISCASPDGLHFTCNEKLSFKKL
jgi:hypothetical protein